MLLIRLVVPTLLGFTLVEPALGQQLYIYPTQGQTNIGAYTMGLVGYLLRLANRPRVPAGARSGLRGEFPANLQGIPAAAEAGLLLNRSGDGEAAEQVAARSSVREYGRVSAALTKRG